ncbi:MAG: universal stress protein [Chitinophagaceae bacterium]|jgi:nucleotide-binding universal stress UspA family protein|nr:universal stress protein [Chitinophagaceae bacterium]
MKKVLIAIEGGPLTETVVQHGINLAHLIEAEIGLVYVVDATGFMGEGGYTIQNYIQDSHTEAKELFAKLKSEFDIRQTWNFIEDGKLAAKIIETAIEWKADYIVVGTHGRTGVSHLLMGSVAEHVIRLSNIPVLVITPEHK